MVTLCIVLGQEHPEGVLQVSDTETVLAFQCVSNMMAMMCHLTAAMIWWDEPIVLCILPPKGRQVREYVTMRSSHQSHTQMYIQGRGMGTQPLPNMHHLDKGPSEAQESTPQAEISRDV